MMTRPCKSNPSRPIKEGEKEEGRTKKLQNSAEDASLLSFFLHSFIHSFLPSFLLPLPFFFSLWFSNKVERRQTKTNKNSVNCVFNPEYIDSMFPKSAKYRHNLLSEARATNYGVVRLELIEALYERMYDQRREIGVDETKWPHRIMGGKQIISMESHGEVMQLRVRNIYEDDIDGFVDASQDEIIEADLVIAATGYRRDLHVGMLKDAWDLLPKTTPGDVEFSKGISGWNVDTEQGERKIAVGRDYKVKFAPGAVAEDAGVWLQGCCEGTHGVSCLASFPVAHLVYLSKN